MTKGETVKFTIKGEVPDIVGLDPFDSLFGLFQAIQASDAADVAKLRGRFGPVKLRINKSGWWSDD